ncbi:MAG: pyridoxal phosphate-dependent aminotransferase [Bacillales bacterium]|jgi:aspartate/tyrosine/aromatic aminotransferase|nr:pyridoxal phosphate-dependent aminotransferase [Bacillales bacterium]
MGYDILELSQEAKEKRNKGIEIIDATIGVLYDDKGDFFASKIIKKIIKSLSNLEMFDYSEIKGGKEYENKIISFLFNDNFNKLITKYDYDFCATPGATASLFIALKREIKNKVLIGTPYWNNYDSIAKSCNKEIKYYDYFKNNRLNITEIQHLLQEDDEVLLIINDPCHNPTGYSFSEKDYISLFQLLSQHPQTVLILDVAYYSFSKLKYKFYDYISLLNNRFYVCFSGSKIFSAYGLRIGGLFTFNLKNQKDNLDKQENIARSVWSNSPIIAISAINHLTNQDLINFQKDLQKRVNLLSQRGKQFKSLAKQYNLPLYPYKEGFFITIKSNNPELLFEELKKENIYVIPQKDSIRISLAKLESKYINKIISKIAEKLL